MRRCEEELGSSTTTTAAAEVRGHHSHKLTPLSLRAEQRQQPLVQIRQQEQQRGNRRKQDDGAAILGRRTSDSVWV